MFSRIWSALSTLLSSRL